MEFERSQQNYARNRRTRDQEYTKTVSLSSPPKASSLEGEEDRKLFLVYPTYSRSSVENPPAMSTLSTSGTGSASFIGVPCPPLEIRTLSTSGTTSVAAMVTSLATSNPHQDQNLRTYNCSISSGSKMKDENKGWNRCLHVGQLFERLYDNLKLFLEIFRVLSRKA